MNLVSIFLKFLGPLPAADSIRGRLSGLDWHKTIRSTLLPGIGAYVLVAVAEKLLHDLTGWGIPGGFTAQAMVILAPSLEMLRRKYATMFQSLPQ